MNLAEFSQLHLIYCCHVAWLDDWHYQYFCDEALVKQRSRVLETWGDDDNIYGEAARLDIEEIQALQEKLSSLWDEHKWYFRQAIFTFVAIWG